MNAWNEQGHALEAQLGGADCRSPQSGELTPPLGSASRDALIESLTPEKRALFDSISKLRRKIGPISFDIVNALREIREDG
ncbi:hypothetical protein [Aquisphaera insulae]|uniref:hypothetical protein n=1 Tax=Aquisphaera insulae TaxID=2712864 RepID=UPI0013ED9080|nr:hypothetical protein [Aquisphaera insulae]